MSANGRLRDDELEVVQAPVRLAKATASAWRALVAETKRQTGVTITITTPRGGYRDLAMQKAIAGTGNHQYKPGTSVHGTGRCVDVWNWAAVGTKRLDALAARFGFRRTISHEPWHYQHDGTAPAAVVTPIATSTRKDDDMRVIQNTSPEGSFRGDVAVVSPDLLLRKLGAGTFDAVAARFGIEKVEGDTAFTGRLAEAGWTRADWERVRALNKSNACLRPGGTPYVAG